MDNEWIIDTCKKNGDYELMLMAGKVLTMATTKLKSCSISILPKHSKPAKAAYFCLCSKSSFFRCGNWNPPKERSGLGGAAAGKA